MLAQIKNKYVWINKKGIACSIKKLEDQHLLNILSFLEKNLQRRAFHIGNQAEALASTMLGEHAIDDLEKVADHFFSDEAEMEEVYPNVEILYDEADRRRLIRSTNFENNKW